MKILVSYSGTKESEAALELAKKHAKIFEAKLVVVFSSEGGKGEKPEEINKIENDLESIQKDISKDGIECAQENDIEQIYVGIRKKSRTSKLILGSTAQYIILKAKCPVTSVK